MKTWLFILVPIIIILAGQVSAAIGFIVVICIGAAIGLFCIWRGTACTRRNGWQAAMKGLATVAGAAVFVVVLLLMQSQLVSPDASPLGLANSSSAQRSASK